MNSVSWETVLALEVRRAVRRLAPQLRDIDLQRRLSRARTELHHLKSQLTMLEQRIDALENPPEARACRSRLGRFLAGVSVPSHNHARRPNSGSFCPGQEPPNTLPIGTERRTRDGIQIKIAEPDPYTSNPNRWVRKPRYVWEQTHARKVPPRCVILQIDSDPFNCEPDNLVCIERPTLPVLAKLGFHRLPLPERRTEIARVQLLVLARRRAREELVGGYTMHRRTTR